MVGNSFEQEIDLCFVKALCTWMFLIHSIFSRSLLFDACNALW